MKSNPTLVALSLALGINGAAKAVDGIPVVPLSVMKKNVPAPLVANKNAANKEKASPSNTYPKKTGKYTSESVLVMTPGVNQIIPVSIGHPNRIVTPFGKPEVTSTSLTPGQNGACGEICIKENVIYVASNKDHPVTMFITEKGSEARALSLTMVPQRIPPREVFLKLDNQSLLPGAFSNSKAKSWEQSQPYIETIRTVFRSIALGNIPSGYSMNRTPQMARTPSCDQIGIDFNFSQGQMMMGHHLTVFVGVARNITNQPIEFKEQSCGQWEVAAVTSWPYKMLQPGQRTEVYVAMKQRSKTAPATKRPSLVNVGGM